VKLLLDSVRSKIAIATANSPNHPADHALKAIFDRMSLQTNAPNPDTLIDCEALKASGFKNAGVFVVNRRPPTSTAWTSLNSGA
jgi:hypothetical protein